MSQRGAILRLSALVLALVEIPIVISAALNPASLGLSATFVALVGGSHVVAQLALAAVPWQRLMADGRYWWVPRVHVVVNLGALFLSVVVAGEIRNDLLWVIALGLVYSGVILPLRDNIVALLITSSILAPAIIVADGELLTALAVAIGVSLLASLGSTVRSTAITTATDGRAQAERTAAALRAALDSAGDSVTVDRQRILQAVVEGAARINSDQAGVYWLTPDRRHCTYAATHGIPAHLEDAIFDATTGVKGRAMATGRTAFVHDYQNEDGAMPEFRLSGLQIAIGSPIRVRGEIVGMLVAGRESARDYTPDEVETFELLATNAGRALEMSDQVDSDRRLLATLQELDDQKRDFVTMVSHELRTPLTVIGGLSSTLLAHADALPEDQRQHMLERIHANAESLGSIVGSLLDTAGIDRGIIAPNLEVVDLTDLATAARLRLEALFIDHVLEMDLPDAAWVLGDPALLARVIDNLLTNALRHTPDGTRVTVSVAEQPGDRWLVSVMDDGPGIATEDLERIMDRFVRGGPPNTRPRGGLGLGLALCKEILGLHDTRLRLASTPGSTAFRFSLPRTTTPDRVDPVPTEQVSRS